MWTCMCLRKTDSPSSKTGNKYPFYHREIEDKNFIFHLKNGPGTHVFYLG